MKTKLTMLFIRRHEYGYALLEYCAGAAIIAGVLWVALDQLGGNLSTLLNTVGQWALTRANGVNH